MDHHVDANNRNSERHHDRDYDSGGYMCLTCNKSFATPHTLKRHKITVHEPPAFQCSICDTKFTEKGSFKRHLKNRHGLAYCFHCHAMFPFNTKFSHVCKM